MSQLASRLLCNLVCCLFAGIALTAPIQPAAQAPPAPAWCTAAFHSPRQPKSNEGVKITIATTPDIAQATLQYQLVEPGNYFEFKSPAYSSSWLSLPMKPDESVKEKKVFVVDLPNTLQQHRRLVRYRIIASDSAGKRLQYPDPASTSPNLAYFVYDGIPAWAGAINPQDSDPRLSTSHRFTAEAMSRVQTYHLLAKKDSIENVTWREQDRGKEYKYTGTLVFDGEVYDHVKYRARGGVWRYATGKNMWKFDLPDDHKLAARDDYGRLYPVHWAKVNLRACIQLGNYGRRGEQGMYESVGYRLFNLAGVDAPRTHWIQLRIIDEPVENPGDQYRGDFWGLYLAIENEDGRFLKAHDLPDGNMFKMFGGSGELEHNGAGQPSDRSDLEAFMEAYTQENRSEAWWRSQVNLPQYYGYRSIVECIHHYDIADGKNYDYFHNTTTGKWHVIPWDIDQTWATHMYGSGDEPFKQRVLSRPAFKLEYLNRLREIRDLLYNSEQTGQLIDECAAIISDPSGVPSIVEADRRKWDYHPALSIGGQAGQGDFYKASRTRDFPGMVQLMKDYVRTRGSWVDSTLLKDLRIPSTPIIEYIGPKNYPGDRLAFRPGGYQGANAFAAMKWRIAEITPADDRMTLARHYEITPLWQSEELTRSVDAVNIPAEIAIPGHTYRIRARVKDTTGRWSHWSSAIEFSPTK